MPPGPRIMRKLWSNLREQTQGNEKRQVEDNSYCKTIEGLLSATARKIFPESEDIDNPMIAPQDFVVRQSGRVLELRNRSLDTTNRSVLALTLLVTIREEPFRNFRGRSLAKLKARDDKIEEAKKQKTQKRKDDEWNSSRWQTLFVQSIFDSFPLPLPYCRKFALLSNSLAVGVAFDPFQFFFFSLFSVAVWSSCYPDR